MDRQLVVDQYDLVEKLPGIKSNSLEVFDLKALVETIRTKMIETILLLRICFYSYSKLYNGLYVYGQATSL